MNESEHNTEELTNEEFWDLMNDSSEIFTCLGRTLQIINLRECRCEHRRMEASNG